MMTPVITALLRIKVVPLGVIYRNTHLLRISMIHALVAAVVFLTPVILRIIYVGIMVKPIPIVCAIRTTPTLTIGPLLSIHATLDSQANKSCAGSNHQYSFEPEL